MSELAFRAFKKALKSGRASQLHAAMDAYGPYLQSDFCNLPLLPRWRRPLYRPLFRREKALVARCLQFGALRGIWCDCFLHRILDPSVLLNAFYYQDWLDIFSGEGDVVLPSLSLSGVTRPALKRFVSYLRANDMQCLVVDVAEHERQDASDCSSLLVELLKHRPSMQLGDQEFQCLIQWHHDRLFESCFDDARFWQELHRTKTRIVVHGAMIREIESLSRRVETEYDAIKERYAAMLSDTEISDFEEMCSGQFKESRPVFKRRRWYLKDDVVPFRLALCTLKRILMRYLFVICGVAGSALELVEIARHLVPSEYYEFIRPFVVDQMCGLIKRAYTGKERLAD